MQHPEHFGIGRLFWLTSEAIVAADVETERIVLWNPAATLLFGYEESEAVGMPLERLVPDDVREAHLAGLRRYRSGGVGSGRLVGQGAVDVPAVTKAGERRDVSLSLTDDGTGRHVLAVIRDVTDEREAERQLQRTNDAMRDFVATASHDLRAPLTAVLGFAKTLRDHGELLSDADRSASIDAILRGAQHATQLVDDLLTLSQLQAGVLLSRVDRVVVRGAVAEAVRQSGVDAAVEVPASLEVRVDPLHLERILVNFLVNAQRYGAAPLRVTADPGGSEVVIRVWDAGDGVPEGFLPRLFTPFARADPSRRDGTGLGLSIVKGLAEANGGRVVYEPVAGGGSCFGVGLPAA